MLIYWRVYWWNTAIHSHIPKTRIDTDPQRDLLPAWRTMSLGSFIMKLTCRGVSSMARLREKPRKFRGNYMISNENPDLRGEFKKQEISRNIGSLVTRLGSYRVNNSVGGIIGNIRGLTSLKMVNNPGVGEPPRNPPPCWPYFCWPWHCP